MMLKFLNIVYRLIVILIRFGLDIDVCVIDEAREI